MSDETIKTDAGDGSASANTDNTASATNPDGGNNTDSNKNFSAGQQEHIQKLIDASYQRAYTKAQASGNAENEKLKAEIEASKKSETKKGATDNEEVQRIIAENNATHEAKLNELTSKLSSMNDASKTSALLGAISKHNVVDATSIAMLIQNDVSMAEDGTFTINGDGGSPRIDATTGAPLGLDEYVTGWLAERSHYLRANQAQGGGSAGSKFGEGGAPKVDFTSVESVRNASIGDLREALDKGVTITGAQGQELKFSKTENPFLEARKRKFAKTA